MVHEHAPPASAEREEVQALAGLVAWFTITAAWWWLALWPMDAAPVWLQRTRYACFGVGMTGLPDGGGWIGLIAGPLGMLLILLVGWHNGVRALLLRARHSRTTAAIVGGLALGCLAIVAGATLRVQQVRASTTLEQPDPAIPAENYPRLDRPAPRLVLTDQYGEQRDLAQLKGRPVLVTFAFAHCQTICPLVVMNALRARDALAGTTAEPAVLIVTLDPWRDPPSRLPAMAQAWGVPGEGAWVLSGGVEDVEATLDAWQVPRRRDDTTGAVTHPALTYVIDRTGRIAFAATGSAQTLVALIRRF